MDNVMYISDIYVKIDIWHIGVRLDDKSPLKMCMKGSRYARCIAFLKLGSRWLLTAPPNHIYINNNIFLVHIKGATSICFYTHSLNCKLWQFLPKTFIRNLRKNSGGLFDFYMTVHLTLQIFPLVVNFAPADSKNNYYTESLTLFSCSIFTV